jgi:hypothetical protein
MIFILSFFSTFVNPKNVAGIEKQKIITFIEISIGANKRKAPNGM